MWGTVARKTWAMRAGARESCSLMDTQALPRDGSRHGRGDIFTHLESVKTFTMALVLRPPLSPYPHL